MSAGLTARAGGGGEPGPGCVEVRAAGRAGVMGTGQGHRGGASGRASSAEDTGGAAMADDGRRTMGGGRWTMGGDKMMVMTTKDGPTETFPAV